MPLGARASIELLTKRPAAFVETVPGIQDCEAARNFEGVSFTAQDLLNLLLAKFQHIPFFKVEPGLDAVNIVTATYSEKIGDTIHQRFLNNHDRLRVETFLEGLKSGMAFAFRE